MWIARTVGCSFAAYITLVSFGKPIKGLNQANDMVAECGCRSTLGGNGTSFKTAGWRGVFGLLYLGD